MTRSKHLALFITQKSQDGLSANKKTKGTNSSVSEYSLASSRPMLLLIEQENIWMGLVLAMSQIKLALLFKNL